MPSDEPQDCGDETWVQAKVAGCPGVWEGSELWPWLLVGEQIPVSPEENGDTLDLLFLNPEAVPVIVEAKRGKKRGVSRSAIGQILDDAAAVAQWSEQALRGHCVKTCSKHRVDPEETFHRVFGAQQCQEEVWRQAATNLHQRTVRLLIVADHIPAKLCRIADFLNAEMAATQVVPCELGEYDVAGKRTWVPKVVHGAEVQARQPADSPSAEARWADSVFFEKLDNPESERVVRKIVAWAPAHH